ncbi:MAG: hypothetical protein K9H64_17275 [Bacteroidales bacterium]|nr:hypothetical protein [Bacteroidales bacterium]MCF8457712.1 hypothetical protein [Bacteroidales bacterium]
MKDLPRITEIIKIEPFKITCRWTTGEVRVNDLEPEFEKWEESGRNFIMPLKEYENFENVVVKDGTLQWPSVEISYTDLNGITQSQALDFDPDVLYRESKSLSVYKLVMNVAKLSKKKAMA